jgi:hypothetical protein
MKRYLALCLMLVSLAALASADELKPPDADRILLTQRDQSLVQKLVAGGLRLAKEEDHLRRAQYCNDLAKNLADEIRQAADDHDGDRAVELGRHLQEMLQTGVAANLDRERAQIPPGSSREPELGAVRQQTESFISLLLEDLAQGMKDNPAAWQELQHAIQEAQAAVVQPVSQR